MKKNKIYICDVIFMFLLIFLDQLTKYLAKAALDGKQAFSIIDGWLEFNYLQNTGAAFGMLKNQKILFLLIAILFLAVVSYVLIKAPAEKKYNKLHILLILISAGAIGNMIDRIRLEYVVDFIYVKIINFPIFNVADIYVTCSTIILILVILFGYKENDFSFLSFKPQEKKEDKE